MLRSALTDTPCDGSALAGLTDDDWRQLIALARFNRVLALCSHAVAQLPREQQPPRKLWLPWVASQDIVTQKALHKNRVAHELVTLLQQHDIDTVVLKGPRLAACYPHPELREYDDIDVFHPGKQREADEVVRQTLRLTVNTDDPHHSTYTFQGVTVENHCSFAHNWHVPSNSDYETLLLRHVPSATFDALYLLRHTASHFAASHATVKSLCDWAMFVRKHRDEVDWDEVARQTRRFGMAPFVAALQRIVNEQLHIAPIAQLDIDIAPTLAERVCHDMLHGEFAQPSHPKAGLSRTVWKWRRYRANRWKRRLVYRDPEIAILLRGLVGHLRQPRNLTHKH